MSEKGEWNPGEKYKRLLGHIQEILDGGEQRTVRDVYYALEATGNHHEYRYVKRAVKKGRRAGFIDPSQIIDASRSAEVTQSEGYDDPENFVDSRIEGVWNDYWENHWREQETYIEVWLEKQSLASVFKPICRRYNVRLEATRGDWSDSKVYEATQRLLSKSSEGKDIHILYFGDFNPSGYHAPVSILDTMGYYGLELDREFPKSGDPRYYDPEHGCPFVNEETGGSISLHRKAINYDHIQQFDLPQNPVPSGSDKDEKIKNYFQRFVSEGDDVNVELNALKEFEREFLEDLVEDSITEYIDDEVKQEVDQRIIETRNTLEDAIEIDRDML